MVNMVKNSDQSRPIDTMVEVKKLYDPILKFEVIFGFIIFTISNLDFGQDNLKF